MSNPSGIDVSHYQGTVDWSAVAAGGVTFAFAKATEGNSYVDSQFATNWAAMKAGGVLRGAYHFFEPNDDGAAQGRHFLATVGSDIGDLPPVIDIETGTPTQSGVQAWLDTVESGSGTKPMIYASLSFANDYLSAFGSYPLWIAEYRSGSPTLPSAWDTWTFWQYSQSGSVSGVSGSVDQDYHNGALGTTPASTGATSTTISTSTGTTYTVASGDTLGAIAAKFGTTVDAIAAANGISDPNVIEVGQVLQIP